MLARWSTYLSLICFCLLSLMVLQMTKRPLCIDSKVVEKIDRVTESGTETLYRCAVDKATPYSVYFSENLREISYRVQKIERLLESLEPFYRRIQVTILKEKPYLFRVQGHHIFIGEELLKTPGHFERALAKIWYRERNQNVFVQQELMEEVVTDLLLYLSSGKVVIQDPVTAEVGSFEQLKWPFVLKSVESYCASPWKKSEHISFCQSPRYQLELRQQAVDMSLRPLLVKSMVQAYKDLSSADRYAFYRQLPLFIRQENDLRTQINPVAATTLLQRAGEALKAANLFVSNPQALKRSRVHRVFVSNFTNELRHLGYSDAFMDASFDVLFVSKEPLSEKSPLYQDLLSWSKSHPQAQVALRDDHSLWMLPSPHAIPLKAFGQIKAAKTLIENCGEYDFKYVLQYGELTEKLLVVDHCDQEKKISYGAFLSEGTKEFARKNKGVTFVQFHIPSMLLKKSELASEGNVKEFILKRETAIPSFKSLGWQEIRYSEEAQAYQPKAVVDAIEWFRIL